MFSRAFIKTDIDFFDFPFCFSRVTILILLAITCLSISLATSASDGTSPLNITSLSDEEDFCCLESMDGNSTSSRSFSSLSFSCCSSSFASASSSSTSRRSSSRMFCVETEERHLVLCSKFSDFKRGQQFASILPFLFLPLSMVRSLLTKSLHWLSQLYFFPYQVRRFSVS